MESSDFILISTYFPDHVHDCVNLRDCVVVEEAEPGDSCGQTELLVHQLHRVVVAMTAAHSSPDQLGGQMTGVRHS